MNVGVSYLSDTLALQRTPSQVVARLAALFDIREPLDFDSQIEIDVDLSLHLEPPERGDYWTPDYVPTPTVEELVLRRATFYCLNSSWVMVELVAGTEAYATLWMQLQIEWSDDQIVESVLS